MQENNTRYEALFTLFHICDAVNKLNNEQLQILSRILFSRLEDLRSVGNSLISLDQNISHIINDNNPYRAHTESVFFDKKKSSMEKKRIFLLKLKRSLKIQILDAVREIHRVIINQKSLQGTATESLVSSKLREIQLGLSD